MYIVVITLALALLGFSLEYFGIWNVPYSKFSKGPGLNNRFGVVLVYLIPILIFNSIWISFKITPNFLSYILLICFNLHFGKRILEALFLHKYSRNFSYVGFLFALTMYSMTAYVLVLANYYSTNASLSLIQNIGLLIFLIAEYMSFRHHKILAELRNNQTGYFIPSEGLFNYSVCPHYFFEIIAWFGYALISNTPTAYLVFITVTLLLAGRSHATREWYRKEFVDFPQKRKRLVPFIY